ncbi:MAG: rdgB [Vampirovibrio sp.]|jgi:XTP/dITP diphosphohydrolase|nr:rdgB [Vampirovibrio sp.]
MNATGQTLIITLASKNEGKRRELAHWLAESGLPVEIALNESAGDVDETGGTFLENAALKARQTPPVPGSQWVLGEDSGMVVDALEGSYGIRPFPGLYSNRWLTPAIRDELLGQSFPNRMPLDRVTETGVTNSDLCEGILALMKEQQNRAARYCCGMVLWHAENGLSFEALESTELAVITEAPRGLNGFGYDPIVVPVLEEGKADTRTVAELSASEKKRISHRGRAFHKVLDFLQKQGQFSG